MPRRRPRQVQLRGRALPGRGGVRELRRDPGVGHGRRRAGRLPWAHPRRGDGLLPADHGLHREPDRDADHRDDVGVLPGRAAMGSTSPATADVSSAAAAISSTAVLFAVYQIYTADPGTLSRRGSIWIAVREALDGWALTGIGVSKWAALQDIGESPQHFFHSTYALFLFAGGAIAVVLFWLVELLDAPGVGRWTIAPRSGAALVVLVLVYSQTEVIWNPLAVDGLTWIYVLLTCGGLASVSRQAVRLTDCAATAGLGRSRADRDDEQAEPQRGLVVCRSDRPCRPARCLLRDSWRGCSASTASVPSRASWRWWPLPPPTPPSVRSTSWLSTSRPGARARWCSSPTGFSSPSSSVARSSCCSCWPRQPWHRPASSPAPSR